MPQPPGRAGGRGPALNERQRQRQAFEAGATARAQIDLTQLEVQMQVAEGCAREIAEAHGGQVSLRNRREGGLVVVMGLGREGP